jgi:Predicted transcriptional regulator, contains C-terminal CBS domains
MEDYTLNTQIVRNWMTPHPFTITPQTTLRKARQLLVDHRIRYLPVVHKDKLVGLVTWPDINRAESEGTGSLRLYGWNRMMERPIAQEFMSDAVITISPNAPLGEAAQLMLEHQIGALPVVEDGKLVGIITETDISLSILHPDSAT